MLVLPNSMAPVWLINSKQVLISKIERKTTLFIFLWSYIIKIPQLMRICIKFNRDNQVLVFLWWEGCTHNIKLFYSLVTTGWSISHTIKLLLVNRKLNLIEPFQNKMKPPRLFKTRKKALTKPKYCYKEKEANASIFVSINQTTSCLFLLIR